MIPTLTDGLRLDGLAPRLVLHRADPRLAGAAPARGLVAGAIGSDAAQHGEAVTAAAAAAAAAAASTGPRRARAGEVPHRRRARGRDPYAQKKDYGRARRNPHHPSVPVRRYDVKVDARVARAGAPRGPGDHCAWGRNPPNLLGDGGDTHASDSAVHRLGRSRLHSGGGRVLGRSRGGINARRGRLGRFEREHRRRGSDRPVGGAPRGSWAFQTWRRRHSIGCRCSCGCP